MVRREIDKSNMYQVILGFPKQFRIGIEAAKKIKVSGKFDAVLICGMGGSALAGEILKIWLRAYKIALPLYIHRNYGLPGSLPGDELINPLVICNSYSGNTEETLTSFQEARRRKMKIIAITSGGKLEKISKDYKIPVVIVPAGLEPRMALGIQFAALMQILVNCEIIENNLKNILALENLLKPKILEFQGKKIAKKLINKIPLIYASDRLKELAKIWKIKFNENSKTQAFFNYFPELNHGELAGYSIKNKILKNFYVLILSDPADHPRILKRMKLTAKILKNKGVGLDFVEIRGKDILFKVFSNILLADWASYYLALNKKVDPTQVRVIEEFKKTLKRS